MKSTTWKLAWGQFSLSASAVCVGSFRHVDANSESLGLLTEASSANTCIAAVPTLHS